MWKIGAVNVISILSYMAEGCFTIITGCVFSIKGETSE